MQSSPVVKHRLCLPFLIVAAVASSGCAVEDPMLGEDELEIVNGQPTSGHPSVVRVMVPAGGWCTGVLITHSSVLTAAHCVTNGAMTVTDVFTGVATVHPDYDGELNDIAVVSTFDKVGRPWHARLAPAVAAGQDITLVGFGRTGFGIPQDNIKRFGTNTIDRLDANFLYFDTDLTAPPRPMRRPASGTRAARPSSATPTASAASPRARTARPWRTHAPPTRASGTTRAPTPTWCGSRTSRATR